MSPAELGDAILRATGGAGLRVADERDLQEQLAALLAAAGVAHQREAPLGPRSRVDFLVGGIVLEVKVGGGLSDLTRQVVRYAEHATVLGVLVVTTRRAHRDLPDQVLGKPLAVLCIGDLLL